MTHDSLVRQGSHVAEWFNNDLVPATGRYPILLILQCSNTLNYMCISQSAILDPEVEQKCIPSY